MIGNKTLNQKSKKDVFEIQCEDDLQNFFIKHFKYYPAQCSEHYYTCDGQPDLFDGMGFYEMKLLRDDTVLLQLKEAESQSIRYSKGYGIPCGIIIGTDKDTYKSNEKTICEYTDRWRKLDKEFWIYIVERRGKPQEKWERKAITEDRVKDMIDMCKNDRDKMIISTLFYTGMRVGEFVAMRRHWIEIKDDLLVIKVPFNEGDFQCKTKAGRRFIYVADEMAIKRILEWYDTHNDGVGIKRVMIWKIVKKIAIDAGIEHEMTTHSLRHSFATHLAELGMSPNYIQKIMGHEKATLAMEVYIHAIEGNVPNEVELLKSKTKPNF